jgi:hypothetical protein
MAPLMPCVSSLPLSLTFALHTSAILVALLVLTQVDPLCLVTFAHEVFWSFKVHDFNMDYITYIKLWKLYIYCVVFQSPTTNVPDITKFWKHFNLASEIFSCQFNICLLVTQYVEVRKKNKTLTEIQLKRKLKH